jgi:tripartite-type tricarboxylate transporter receptor subunit TctC
VELFREISQKTTINRLRKVFFGLAIFASVIGASYGFAEAQDFPSRPITFIVPYPPGGNVDVSARILQNAIGGALGQPIIIENKPGGAGFIAGQFVARSKPDGYTLFVASNGPILLGPMISTNPPYHWNDAFVPISSLSFAPTLLLVRKNFPVKNVKEFLAYAREHSQQVTVGFGGVGSINNLVSEMMQQVTGVKWVGVNFRGNAPLMNDLIGEHVDAAFIQPIDALPQVQSGTIRVLAVIAEKRLASLPNVPTMKEAGFPTIVGLTFSGLFAPKGTPQSTVNKLSKTFDEALKKPSAIKQFDKLGSQALGSTPEEFTKFMTDQTAIWSEVVKKGNIHIEN